jgi:HK97 family phage prohead protease
VNKELVSRAYLCEVRAEQNERGNIITGRPIVYNSRTDLGYYDEIIDSGALDGTDLTDVRFLVNHNTKGIPLARSRRNNGNSTMLLSPDIEGMAIRAEIDVENNAEAKSLWSAVGRGDIDGMSFMFSIDEESWENLESDRPTHHILKIGSIVEVSAVNFPAYQATSIQQARSKEALESARQALENARQQRAASVETDEIEILRAKANLLTLI